MKNKLIRFALQFTRMLAGIWQLGNPAGKPPKLISKPIDSNKLSFDFTNRHHINFWKLDDALCSSLYGGAVIGRENKMYESFSQFPWGMELHPVVSQPYLGKLRQKIDQGIFLVTPEAKNNYYHWMIDLLPRLLLAKKYSIEEFRSRRIILHAPAKDYEDQTLALAGVLPEQVVRLKPFELVQVQDLFVSDYESGEMVFPQWKKELLEEFRDEIVGETRSTDSKKIYLVRGRQKKRRLIGEEQLVNALEKIGFEAVDPQSLSVREQIKLLSQASIVVALHGAALTNLIFCKPGTRVIEIRNDQDAPEFFRALSNIYGLHFETLGLSPRQEKQTRISSNKQDLLLRQEDVETLVLSAG